MRAGNKDTPSLRQAIDQALAVPLIVVEDGDYLVDGVGSTFDPIENGAIGAEAPESATLPTRSVVCGRIAGEIRSSHEK